MTDEQNDEARLLEQIGDLETELSTKVSARDLTIRDLRDELSAERSRLSHIKEVIRQYGAPQHNHQKGQSCPLCDAWDAWEKWEKATKLAQEPESQARAMSDARDAQQCSGCAREMRVRPGAACPNVTHWRAWAATRERLPNGWNQPTFLGVDDEGALHIEWCFGEQGGAESHRVVFVWDPSEGAMSCRTDHENQSLDEGATAATSLSGWLEASRENGQK